MATFMWFWTDALHTAVEHEVKHDKCSTLHDGKHKSLPVLSVAVAQYLCSCGNALPVSWWRMLNGDPCGMKWAMR